MTFDKLTSNAPFVRLYMIADYSEFFLMRSKKNLDGSLVKQKNIRSLQLITYVLLFGISPALSECI